MATTKICKDVDELCSELPGSSAAIVTEEALTATSLRNLASTLRTQPSWSDLRLDGGKVVSQSEAPPPMEKHPEPTLRPGPPAGARIRVVPDGGGAAQAATLMS